MFRTKSFADIAAVFPYSRSSGKDKEKGQEKEQSSPSLLKGVMPFKIHPVTYAISFHRHSRHSSATLSCKWHLLPLQFL